MTQELDEKLCAKYPKIFVNRHANMKTTCMCWGMECGDGWYWLIDNLCSNLQWNTDNNNRQYKIKLPRWKKVINFIFRKEVFPTLTPFPYPQIVASQVKEKFGGLRFYVEGAMPAQHSVISFAESLSYKICEKCGSTKNIGRTKGWISTLCEDCKDNSKHIWTKNEEN